MGHTLSSIPNLLERGALTHEEPRLNSSQWEMDGSLSNFSAQAANPYLITSFMIGQSAKRLFDFVASPMAQSLLGTSAFSASAVWTSRVSLGIYKTLRLGSEATAFEIGHRSLQVGFQGADSSLLAWNGSHGLRNGLIHSSLNFFTLHGIGKIAAGENIVFQHFLQSTGIVAANQMAAAIDLLPNSNQNLVAQLFEAEIFNIQQQGTAQLSPTNKHVFQEDITLQFITERSPSPELKIPLGIEKLSIAFAKVAQGGNEGQAPSPLNKIVVLGDIHAKWQHVQKIMDHEFPEGHGTALAVGDLQSYPLLENGHRIYFIPGNHEIEGVITELHARKTHPNYTPLLAGEVLRLGALTVAGMPGVYSEYFYANPAGAPVKYFTPERLASVAGLKTPLDILLMHDAPAGLGFRKNEKDLGHPLLTGLISTLQPSLVFFGHHHQSFEGRLDNTRIVGLDYPKRSYVVIDIAEKAFSLRRYDADLVEIRASGGEFKYPWERSINTLGQPLFDGEAIMSNKTEMIRTRLEREFRETLIRELTQVILLDIPASNDRRDFQAKMRASLAANDALSYAAEYAAFLDSKPHANLSERKTKMGEIYDRMSEGVDPQSTPNLIRAFEDYLKFLGIVNS